MTRFKSEQEWREFCDSSLKCICGRLMTGLHMRQCAKVKKQDEKFRTVHGAMRETESGGHA